ncbi:uncharacterized protein IL334_003697 [Kwoniella shivajii]|uniref:Uncharacterized protein n=1 Tax=Kwoniella shivajii TaxID=564305 RepID=A0ABZ1CZI1_9TREE|nr:hypothetical protein IL334_003697 [Kwoniella shivajii]
MKLKARSSLLLQEAPLPTIPVPHDTCQHASSKITRLLDNLVEYLDIFLELYTHVYRFIPIIAMLATLCTVYLIYLNLLNLVNMISGGDQDSFGDPFDPLSAPSALQRSLNGPVSQTALIAAPVKAPFVWKRRFPDSPRKPKNHAKESKAEVTHTQNTHINQDLKLARLLLKAELMNKIHQKFDRKVAKEIRRFQQSKSRSGQKRERKRKEKMDLKFSKLKKEFIEETGLSTIYE